MKERERQGGVQYSTQTHRRGVVSLLILVIVVVVRLLSLLHTQHP